MKHLRILPLTAVAAFALALSGCASMHSHSKFSQASLPAAVQVPAGHHVVMEAVGVGQITYACQAKKDMPSAHEWVFVGPDAQLQSRSGAVVGKYWGPPATWESNDGSKVTAKQLAVSPAGSGNIPMQLVQAQPATGMGAMQGISYIQRVATKGGVAPAMACAAANVGSQQTVPYEADYIFWKAM